jgi:putative transcriptional regulator
MVPVRKSLEEIEAAKPDIDQAKVDATSEEDIRRHMIEDGEDPDHEFQINDVSRRR